MRKLMALLLALVLLCTSAGFAEALNDAPATADVPATADASTGAEGAEALEEPVVLTPAEIALAGRPVSEEPTHITVGNTTKVSGDFFTSMWSNNTSDIDVRTMIHGYSPVVWDSQVEFVLDHMVVDTVEGTADGANTVYTITLQQDLVYSDGETPITAADYVFSYLLCASDEVAQLGAQTRQYEHIVGYEEYASGESDVFTGVRLLDTYTYSITVKGSYEPFFYNYAYLRTNPYPISVIAPYCEVADDGDGAYLRSMDPEAEEVPFTVEVLTETIFDEETGYMSHPSLTSGPYTLTAYDEESGQVDFAINPYYKGNYEGVVPVIDTITLVPVLPETMIDQLASGEIDLLNKCVDSDVILGGMALANQGITNRNYARLGYGFCAFACEMGATQFEKVRQAIAYSFDQDAFIMEHLGSFAIAVYSYYGVGQWMTLAAMGALLPGGAEGEEALLWDEINLDELNHYDPDPEAALALLIEDGWTLNENGEPFDPEVDTVRYKDVDGELMSLTIRFAKVEGNEGADLVVEQLSETLPALGFEFIVEEVSFSDMLSDYYREDGERQYNMNFMATNFSNAFDPYYTFITDPSVQGATNTSGIADEELMELAWEMRITYPGQYLTYEENWLAFVERFNELLPTMPIYSNIYFDFFTDWLQNYEPATYYSWPVAILYAYYAEPEEPVEEAPLPGTEEIIEEAPAGDDEIIIID